MRVAVAFAVLVLVGDQAVAETGAQRLGDAYRAYERGDLVAAKTALTGLDLEALANRDYGLWLRGMVSLRTGDYRTAERSFEALGKLASAFDREVPWRLADIAWERGDRAVAAKAYAKLVTLKVEAAGPEKVGNPGGDLGTAMFRIAEVKTGKAADAAYRAFLVGYPSHPLAGRAEAILADHDAPPFTAAERIERAKNLTDAKLWDEAVAEFSLIDKAALSDEDLRQRDYWLGTTLFKMRRRYDESAELLLGVYAKMGASAAEAMFHGARAKSRSDQDDEAIAWYRKVVAAYPKTPWAEEAQFLSGWLEFNRGKYREAIGPLEDLLSRYPKSKWTDDALWFLGMSHYFLGEWANARTRLVALSKIGGSLEGGKGMYWLARLDEKLTNKADAINGYSRTVQRFPFSWYALLSHARLEALGVKLGPFGIGDPKPRGAKLAASVDPALVSDELIRRADELIAAGLVIEAGNELERGERAFIKRHDKAAALAALFDRYTKAGNFNRPWMLSITMHGGALDGAPIDDGLRWWTNAYPRAYQNLVDKYGKLGDNPEGYLYSIMRKESGYDPHVLSYADAQGLMQMIPATTKRVAIELKLPYDPGKLYEPAYNVQTASWYIGHLLQKFKGQIPFGAGSFNSGPKPVMAWLDKHGSREIDELVELVPFTQTREYMKKVTENYARYRYLYGNEVYAQPLTVDKAYLKNQLTY